ncbi:MAG: RNA polymerase sigma factor [Acidimicrobiia bacterium]
MTGGNRAEQTMLNQEVRFTELYRRYGRELHAYCARRSPGSQAADAVAETFLVAWRKIDQVPNGEAALPWLYGVAFRVLSHQWRRSARSGRLLEKLQGLAEVETPTPDLVLVRRTEGQTVMKAAARLRPIDQEILRLTLWEELSHADAAIVLGLEPGAVKQRAFRARRNLANEYLKLTKDNLPPAALKGGGS